MSLVPLMTPRIISVGAHCIDLSLSTGQEELERTMTVIGLYQDSTKRAALYPSAENTDYLCVKGL